MSEETDLGEFTEKGPGKSEKRPIDAVPEASVDSSLDETSVGEIPSDWKVTRLSDIAKEVEYGLSESSEPFDPDKPRYIRTQDFDDFGGLQEDSRASLSREKAKDGLLGEGDILFARSGSVGASLGKTYLYDADHGDCCFGGYSIRHRLQREGLNHRYISQYTLSERYWDWIRRRAKTTAQSNINTSEYGSLLLPIPPLEEQRKIASVLYKIDQAIEKTYGIITRCEKLQTGLLRKFFGKQSVEEDYSDDRVVKRLGPKSYSVPKEWETVKIADVGEVITGDTPSTKNEAYYGGKLPFVTPDDFGDGKYVYSGGRGLTDEGRQKARQVPEDSVLVDCIGMDMGKVRIAGRELATNQQINSVIVNNDEMLPEFLYYHLKAISNLIQSQAGQTRTPIVSKSQFSSFDVFKPPLKAQKEAVTSLAVFDDLIEKEAQYASGLQRLKQGLMQDLLSGDVRTTDADIEVLDAVAQHG